MAPNPASTGNKALGTGAPDLVIILPSVRRRSRCNSLMLPGASSFLCTHPSLTSRVSSAMFSCMLCRHLDTPVYPDSIRPLNCPHCRKPMDARGDHAAIFCNGFGVVHRQNTVRNLLCRYTIHAAGLAQTSKSNFSYPAQRTALLIYSCKHRRRPPPPSRAPDRVRCPHPLSVSPRFAPPWCAGPRWPNGGRSRRQAPRPCPHRAGCLSPPM